MVRVREEHLPLPIIFGKYSLAIHGERSSYHQNLANAPMLGRFANRFIQLPVFKSLSERREHADSVTLRMPASCHLTILL